MWVECVPNFSEGRDPLVLQAIGEAARGHNVKILGFEGDPDHNRSVMTLVGPGEDVAEAVMRAARVAIARIDLTRQTGNHPRMGAVDVIPFVPLEGTPMAYAVELARRTGERLAREEGVPVYLYEEAARHPSRRNLADVRRGQFEGLGARMAADPPDFGVPRPHPTAGAAAVGARRPLIAFNVYLNTTDMAVARAVARAVRGSDGGLRGVKALAMNTERRGRVQVSMNVVDYPTTPLPRVVEMVRQEAGRFGVSVVGSELVGFLPVAALIDTARYYLQLHDLDAGRVLEWAMAEGAAALGETHPGPTGPNFPEAGP